jgi:ABC-2 type transport system ATP-binding protein
VNAHLDTTPTAPLSAHGLSHRYGRWTVLDGIDLQLAPGGVLGLIGKNGAGKSTLIRCLLGLIQPSGGEARVFGDPALQLPDSTKARIGYVPQQPDSLGWLSLAQYLDFIGRFYPQWDPQLAAELTRRWELPTRQMLSRLSPGERQRLALVRALAVRPQLLVLDEPAAALDPVARRQLLRDIALQASDFGASVLFSSHILSDLERVASHVALLDGGRVLLDGELDTIKERHGKLRLPPPLAAQAPDLLPGELRRRRSEDGSLNVLLAAGVDGSWPDIAHAAGARIDTLGLEDLFLEVVE